MARNTYTLDGIPLTDAAGRWFLERDSGLRLIPAKRSTSLSYPGLDGESFVKGSTFLPGGVRIVMHVEGTDHADFMANVEYINNLFLQRHKLLELRHDYNVSGSISRHAFVKFISNSEIQTYGQGMKAGTIEYIATVPGVFWRSITQTTQALPAVTTTPTTVTVTNLTGGNAPVEDSLIRVKGAFTTLTLVDVTTGDQLLINTPLAATEYIIIDPILWTGRKVTSDTWSGGTNVDALVISNRGSGSMFSMEPSLSGTSFLYRITQSAIAPASSPVVEIRAKKAYL
jgi:hypothetical protein